MIHITQILSKVQCKSVYVNFKVSAGVLYLQCCLFVVFCVLVPIYVV